MATKPWGAGSWAADSELAEQHRDAVFPTLGEAVATKTSKKKKGQTLTLSQFNTGAYVGPGGHKEDDSGSFFSDYKGLTPADLMMLPTGPRDRSGDEPTSFGRGFRDYRRDNSDGRDRDSNRYGADKYDGGSRRRDRERDRDRDHVDEPSRADIIDDWGAGKKFVPASGGHYDDDRHRSRDFPSRADDDNHWGNSKTFVPATNFGDRRRGMGRFDDIPSRGGGFHDIQGPSKADTVDNWVSSKKTIPSCAFDSYPRNRDFGGPRNRDDDMWKNDAPNSSSERPRLNLQPRSRLVDSSISAVSGDTDTVKAEDPTSKPQKIDPFGGAKPRELILEAKGMDWKKLDAGLDRKSVDRSETEEMSLKNEIRGLQEAIKRASVNGQVEEGDVLQDMNTQLVLKEQELTKLTDKLSYALERPTSGSGSRDVGNAWSKERPSSGSGNREGGNGWTKDRPISGSVSREAGNVWSNERPTSGSGSRDGGNAWSKPISNGRGRW